MGKSRFVGLVMTALFMSAAGVVYANTDYQLVVSNEPLKPIPLDWSFDEAQAALGQRLFNDPILSKDGSVSCSSCHLLSAGGADGKRYSKGIKGTELEVNTPTVINAALNFSQFWDGRAATLEEQVGFPIQSPDEMGNTWPDVLAKLSASALYANEFNAVFGDKNITVERVSQVLGEYQRSLVKPNSRFDQFLLGDLSAISDEEKSGYLAFKRYGCASCHQGMNVGGNMFETMGLIRDYFGDRGNITEADFGRYNVTKLEEHRFQFKVPSLRNVEFTAPYFHDGTAATLEEAINVMARYQLGRRLPKNDITAIVAFLKTLSNKELQQ